MTIWCKNCGKLLAVKNGPNGNFWAHANGITNWELYCSPREHRLKAEPDFEEPQKVLV